MNTLRTNVVKSWDCPSIQEGRRGEERENSQVEKVLEFKNLNLDAEADLGKETFCAYNEVLSC